LTLRRHARKGTPQHAGVLGNAMRVPWLSVGLGALFGAAAWAQLFATIVQPRMPPFASEDSPYISLIIPVAGVTSAQLTDSWGAARAQGRTHEGIDILAPQGTAVRAAVSGRIVKFFDSERGGVTIYEIDSAGRFIYYYAHLLARAPGLREGDQVRQGQVIGSVGRTGNATVPHLHFEVERLGPEHQWWRAESINPYPLLLAGRPPSA
jgi:murein DD-endopeptidase MepM/ murein hydrolase activator NlpD